MSGDRTARWGVTGLGVALLLLVGALLWFRGDIAQWWAERQEPVEVSPEAAELAERKLRRLQEEGDTIRLSGVELSSLMQFRAPPWATERVHRPTVELVDDTVRFAGTVATDQLPSHPDLDRVRIMLPDSPRVQVVGRLQPLGEGRAALDIARVEFAGIPIPARYYPSVLQRLGRADEPGLAATAFALPLPRGVRAARVEQGYLILSP